MTKLPLVGLVAALLLTSSGSTQAQTPGGEVQAWFSPKGGCADEVIEQIDSARRSVHVQAFAFTNGRIEAALEKAKTRGCDVQVLLDGSWRTSAPTVEAALHTAKIPVAIDRKHAIAHNKVIVIDAVRVLTGSYNFTLQAERSNAENLVLIRNRTVAAQYEAQFARHRAHSNSTFL